MAKYKTILMTGSNSKFLSEIKKYTDSIEKFSNFDRNILIYQNDNNQPAPKFKNLEVYELSPKSVRAPNQNTCIQHGGWLELLPQLNLSDDDVVIFTDGDIELQRPADIGELYTFNNLHHLDVFVGYNFFYEGRSLSLEDEVAVLQSTGTAWHRANKTTFSRPIYNTGVLAMTVSTWKLVYAIYVREWPLFSVCFDHYAKQQWLLSWIFNHEHDDDIYFYVRIMPQIIHMHDHMPIPDITYRDAKDGLVKINGHTILFKHATRVPDQPFSLIPTI